MLAGTGGGPTALEVPLSWRLQGGRQRPDRAQLIAMAERDVGGLVRRIIAEEHRQVQAVHNRGRTFGKRGFRVARTPQLAARESAQIQPGSDDVVIGGRHFVQSQMLSAIDDFFDSDNNKVWREHEWGEIVLLNTGLTCGVLGSCLSRKRSKRRLSRQRMGGRAKAPTSWLRMPWSGLRAATPNLKTSGRMPAKKWLRQLRLTRRLTLLTST